MWIFTRYGFYSVTVNKRNPGVVTLRARVRRHLSNLRERFPKELKATEIYKLDHTDYRWRLDVEQKLWASLLSELALEQTWSNFKAEAEDFTHGQPEGHAYHNALMSVWYTMLYLQHQFSPRKKSKSKQRELSLEEPEELAISPADDPQTRHAETTLFRKNGYTYARREKEQSALCAGKGCMVKVYPPYTFCTKCREEIINRGITGGFSKDWREQLADAVKHIKDDEKEIHEPES